MTTLPEILPAAGLLIAKATFILAVAGMVAFALRRGTAAARHAAWALALGGIVALPLVAGVVPSLPVSFLPALAVEQGTGAESAGAAVEVSRPALPPMSGLLLSTVAEGATPLREPALASPIPGELSAATVAVRLWLAGLILFTAVALLGRLHVWHVARGASVLRDAPLAARARRLASELGITRCIRLLEGDGEVMPMTFGVLRATLLLPASAQEWPIERQDAVLRHELAHIRRRDSLTQLLSDAACAAYWFHPLVWVAAHRLRVEREHACDDAVVVGGTSPAEYAAGLLEIARSMRAPAPLAGSAHAMARRSRLRVRIQALLEDRARADRLRPARLVPACALAMGALALLAALTPADGSPAADMPGAVQSRSDVPVEIEWRGPQPAVDPPPAAVSVPLPPAEPPRCIGTIDGDAHRGTLLTRRAGGRVVAGGAPDAGGQRIVQLRVAGTMLCMLTAGAVDFDADGIRIARMAPDAYMVLEARGESGSQRLVITPSPQGMQHAWYVDDVAHPFDENARAWRDAMIGVLTTHGEISTLHARAAALRAQIASIRGQEAGMRAEIAGIRGRESAMRGELSSLRARVARLERTVLPPEDARVRAAIRDMEARISSPDVQARVAEVETRLAEFDGSTRIAAVQQEHADLDSPRRVRELMERMEARMLRLRSLLAPPR
jgi:beta-lactamase regulating signal transducer with metallopeptidase domain